ncbi:hypothetical protein ACHAXN_012197 [Cyclotella atomus]
MQTLHNDTLYKLYDHNPAPISEDETTNSSAASDPITPRTLARCAVPTAPPRDYNAASILNQSIQPAISVDSDNMAYDFPSLSPERAKIWERDVDSKRAAESKQRIEAEMAAAVAEDSFDSSEDENIQQMQFSEARSHWKAKHQEESSHLSLQKSTPSKAHNWDVDTLLEEHMREIDDCEFGSLHQLNLLGQNQEQPVPQKHPVQQQQPVRQTVSQQRQNNHQMQSNNSAQQQQLTPSKMLQITLSDDQSTVSSPGWSSAQQTTQIRRDLSAAVNSKQLHNVRAPSTSNTKARQPLQNNTLSTPPMQKPPAVPQTSNKEQELQIKLHSLQLQLNQVTTLNSSLQSRIYNDQLQIQQLSSSQEEARQEAALWEAKWRDDTGGDALLHDLRGALLQKTKEEVKVLESKILEMKHHRQGNESIELNLLASENEALRRELSKLADGTVGPAASPSSYQSDAMQRLDRMAKTCRESDQKWSLKVKEVEAKLDQLRRENKVLIVENTQMKQQMEASSNQVNDERLKEMELKLNRDRGEIDRLVKEKSSLVEELRNYKDVVDKASAEHDSLRREFATRLREQTELHSAEMEKFLGKKITVDRGSDAIAFSDEKMEALLAQMSQENVTLQEENTGLSAENERLAKRCVDLEMSLSEAVSNVEDLRIALRNAEVRIGEFEKEKAELERSITLIEQQVAAARSEEVSIQRRADEVIAEKDNLQRQMQDLLTEKQQINSDLQSLKRENEMLQSKNESLEEYHVNAQEELQSWQLAKEEIEAELSATLEENACLKSSNLSMKERLDERQQLLDVIRKNEIDGPLVKENQILKSTLNELENKLRGLESALGMERANLTSARQGKEHAEMRIGELENQIVSLQSDVSAAKSKSSSERESQVRFEKHANELKATIASLREEISSSAISRSHLELELRQRQDEVTLLRQQLDPIQQEKYRLELDNADLFEQVENLRKQIGCGLEEDLTRSELIKRLEEKNNALALCISSLQTDMMAFQGKSAVKSPPTQSQAHGGPESAAHCNHKPCKTTRSNAVSLDVMEQLNRARAAVKETASIIKAQRRAISSDDVRTNPESHTALSPIPMKTPDVSRSGSQNQCMHTSHVPPFEITTATYSQEPSYQHQTPSADRAFAPTPSFDARSNLRVQLEEEHEAEKSAIKTKYRERIRCMRKEWEGERKAILSLIASPAVDSSEGIYRIVKSPVNQPVPRHVTTKETPNSTFCDTETIDSSYLETETFVMNILNELES